jgi:hypothetical protein
VGYPLPRSKHPRAVRLARLADIGCYQTRLVALELAIYVLFSAFIGHFQFGDFNQFQQFTENLAIVGGSVCRFRRRCAYSLDAKRSPQVRFARGDRSDAAALKATLASWRNNHDRFVAIATGNAQLEPALPISADIASLAGIGLDALALVENNRAPDAAWCGRANELLDRQAAAEKASESIVEVITMQQPPADLLISITPGIRKLVEAAAERRP